MRALSLGLILTSMCISIHTQTPTKAGAGAERNAVQPSSGVVHPQGAYATVNGVKIWYESEGSGEPLILIAGGPGFSHSYFHPYFSELANSYRVIYLDSFGRGKSDRAKNASEYTFTRDVEDLEGFRKELGLGKINVLGHSYGGMVALAYALRFPESTSKLILVDAFFSAEMWQVNNDNWNSQIRNQFPEVWEKLTLLRDRGVHSCNREYQDVTYEVPLGLFYFYDASAADKLTRSIEPQSLDVYCSIAGDDADFLIGGDIAKLDFRPQLKSLRAPTLILTGRFDRLAMPRFSLHFKRYAPQAKFVMFEQSGHLPFIEEPTRMFQILRDFLQNPSRP
jgi:proline iminopeptidase